MRRCLEKWYWLWVQTEAVNAASRRSAIAQRTDWRCWWHGDRNGAVSGSVDEGMLNTGIEGGFVCLKGGVVDWRIPQGSWLIVLWIDDEDHESVARYLGVWHWASGVRYQSSDSHSSKNMVSGPRSLVTISEIFPCKSVRFGRLTPDINPRIKLAHASRLRAYVCIDWSLFTISWYAFSSHWNGCGLELSVVWARLHRTL